MFPASAEQLCLLRRPTFRQHVCWRRTGSFLQVAKYLLNNYRIFDTSDDLNGTAAFTRLNIDGEDTLEALCPGHGRPPFGRPRILQCIRQFALIPALALAWLILLSVYVSLLMFVMHHFAGHIVRYIPSVAVLSPEELREVTIYASLESFQSVALVPLLLLPVFGLIWLLGRRKRKSTDDALLNHRR